MCCWHSLERTLGFLQSAGVLEGTFKLMLENTEDVVDNDSEIRRMVYGLITLVDERHLLPPVFSLS